MSAYAPNASPSENGYASLTSSLLARKGEALPAVDAVAHEGIDIDMRPMKPANSPGAPRTIKEDAIEKLYADNPRTPSQSGRPDVRLVHSSGVRRRVHNETPKNWTIPPRTERPARAQTGTPGGVLARKAIVTLRMPARDLVRLRLAARDLEMSCQAIILEALDCYLDANDVPSASDDDAIMREVERLMANAKAKRKN
ncbi:hypothetical protein [Hyphococcus sp.]|uniref:hypothetical protein n=1 Tax=Hyphococcus sp. TaxID=2038636 RepID=UPI0020864D9C|nr:MAG: hypothetical protein DHS20C04_09530 [Marinicaulis sp.]